MRQGRCKAGGRLMCAILLALIVGNGFAQSADTAFSLAGTRGGWEVGAQVATYEYEEPDFAKLEGDRLGVVGAYTALGENGLHARIDGRISYGLLDYTGSGTLNDVDDWIVEARIVGGKDYAVGERFTVGPYIGFGYRYLYNDLRGYSSTGAIGYRRYSHYVYMPVGAVIRAGLSERWALATTLEYDAFLGGRQYSKLTDTNLGYTDASNRQKHGRGYRVYVMLESEKWSMGPWFHYWNIKDSEVVQVAPNVFGLEPENTTHEFGLEARYRF